MKFCKRYTIFVVDQEQAHLDYFGEIFQDWPHLVYYCSSIAEARAILQGVLADILICRLRVPGLLEEDFLGLVRKSCPHAIRMIFSEERDTVSLLKLVAEGKAHRYFCFPCERNGVAVTLTNDLHTRSRIRIRKCWRFLREHTGVPVLPVVVKELEDLLSSPDYDVQDVVRVLRKDPVISARLLQVANAAAFTKIRDIRDLHHAVTYLGVSGTRKVILFICATKYFLYPKKFHRKALKVVRHSLQCSQLAASIAEDILPGQERAAGTAGLLHDLGKLVLLSSLADRRFASIKLPDSFLRNANQFEEQTFGIRHQELGSSLMLWWNLPLVIVEAAANQDMPLGKLDGVPRCVAIADRCLKQVDAGSGGLDLEALRPQMPVDKWLLRASGIVSPDSV